MDIAMTAERSPDELKAADVLLQDYEPAGEALSTL